MRTSVWWRRVAVGAVMGLGVGLGAAGTARAQATPGVPGTNSDYQGTYGAPGVNQPGVPGMVAPGGLAAPQTGTLPPGVSSGYSPSANQYVYGSFPSLNPGLGPGVMPSTGVSQPNGAPALGLGITQNPLEVTPGTGIPGFGQPGSTGLGGLSGNPSFGGPTGNTVPSGPTGAGGGF